MISDADEIVRASVVKDLENIIIDGSNAVEQTLNTYYINWQCTNMPWWGTKILRKKFISTPSEDRFHTPAAKYIWNGGWHFGYMGGADAIKTKIKSYAHQETNIPEVLNNIENRLRDKKDALGRLYEYKVVPLDSHFPQYVLHNQNRFSHMIYKEEQ
jgi:beta-1,4-mannosyl-glycoprotein beta-1,4-N-acetylglucosaminyltransferase